MYFCRNEHASREIQLLYKALTGLSFCQTSCKPASSLARTTPSPRFSFLFWGGETRRVINLVRSLPHYLSIIDITDTCCPVVKLTPLSRTMETRRRNHRLQRRAIAPCTLVFPQSFLAHPSTKTIPRPNVKDRLKKKKKKKERKKKKIPRPFSKTFASE